VKRSQEFIDLALPWAGLAVGVTALGVAHQFGSDGTFDHCLSNSPVPVLLVSTAAILMTLGGAFASWTVFRDDAEAPARKVIAVVSIGSALLFVLAMILPVIAALMIPPCFQ
jgi:hypothetical protein